MTTSVQTREQVVSAALRDIAHIATLPEVTLKIVELVDNPKSTAQDLHKVIANDPALCARILKVVNSSFYGLPGQIGSINRAIVMLGLNAVKNIAIAASLAKLYRGADITPKFSARKVWEHAVATAVTSKFVADKLKFGFADEAFLSGLIHNIGIMVEMQYDRNRLVEIVQAIGLDADGAPAHDMSEAELRVYGASHEHFGAGLCERWKFPRNLTIVTGHHHAPMDVPPESRTLPSLVYLTTRLVGEIPGNFRADLVNLDIDPAVKDCLKMTDAQIDEIRKILPDHLATVGDLLS